MNKDIRLSTDFLSNFKVKKLRRLLGDGAALSLIALWIFVAERRPEGVLHGMDEDDIAMAADWNGDPIDFVATLVSVGLLDVTDDGLAVHDWEENNPWAAGAGHRSKIAKANASKRWSGSNASGMQPACNPHKNGNAPSPSPSPSPSPYPSPNGEGDRAHAHEADASLPPAPVPGLPKGAGHPYSEEQLAAMKAALPPGQAISPSAMPAKIRQEMQALVRTDDLSCDVLEAWRDLDPSLKAEYVIEGLRRAVVAERPAVWRFNYAAKQIGRALANGVTMDADGWKPPANVTNIASAPSKKAEPYADQPWGKLWNIVTGLDEQIRFRELVRDFSEAAGSQVDSKAAWEAHKAGGVVAGMDYLWSIIGPRLRAV